MMSRLLKKIRKRNYVMLLILAVIYCSNIMFTTLSSPLKIARQQADNQRFAGSATCAGCHKEIYESHIKTAHYLDSRPAAKQFIKGSFTEGKNSFTYNQWAAVKLEERGNSFFQTAMVNGVESQSEAFDIVIGSGRKGQTYLYWNGNNLFQLPVSYYTPLNAWCNSPGYSANYPRFDRIIPAQCLECHGTYAESANDENNRPYFDKTAIIYGIDCERCHGAAADHVAFQSANPQVKTAKFIVNAKLLSRQQRLDACALCHSGFRDAIQPAFSFNVGDNLDDFSHARYNPDSISTLDVHGNQYGLLTSSKCFIGSQMDCSSCHNVHDNEANNTALYAQKCIACHANTTHENINLPADKKEILNANCTACHMPMLPSKKIVLDVASTDKSVPDLVRTHRISIYPEQTRIFLEKIRSKKR
jgi:hypothetical protein